MATNFSFSNRVVHFHFLSQKTCTANPLLGHGIIKLPTPLRVTRIVVRASYRPHEKLQPEEAIVNLLKKRDDPLDTVARDLSVTLANIRENQRLYDSCSKILKKNRKHVLRMWEIAGCNHTDTATAILPREPRSTVEWSGFISKDNLSIAAPFEGHREFPLKDKFKMRIERTIERDSAHEYRVVFLDTKDGVPGHLYIDFNAKDSHLAFKCGDKKHGVPDKHSSSLNDQIVLDIRIAAPNVLVGQAKKRDLNASGKHEKVLGEFVLVKQYNNK